MSVYSKFCTPIDGDCKMDFHPREGSCRNMFLGFFTDGFKYSVKTYSVLYLFTSLLQGKLFNKENWPRILEDVLRSSLYMACNTGFYSILHCLMRKIFQTYYIPTIGFLPGALATYFSIFLEKKSRRRLLFIYILNTFSQVYYNVMKNHGLINPVPHGEVILFSLSMAFFLYFYRKGELKKDFISTILRFLCGTNECISRDEPNILTVKNENEEASIKEKETQKSKARNFVSFIPFYSLLVKLNNYFEKGVKHKSCQHQNCCFHYCVTGFLRPFAIGFVTKMMLNLFLLLKSWNIHYNKIISSKNVTLGLQLGFFVASFRIINCALRWFNGSDRDWYGFVGGLVSGLVMVSQPISALASYVFWKLMELFYNKGYDAGFIPDIPFGLELFYAIFCGLLFHTLFLDLDNVNPSYRKYINGLTNSRISKLKFRTLKFSDSGKEIYLP